MCRTVKTASAQSRQSLHCPSTYNVVLDVSFDNKARTVTPFVLRQLAVFYFVTLNENATRCSCVGVTKAGTVQIEISLCGCSCASGSTLLARVIRFTLPQRRSNEISFPARHEFMFLFGFR